MSHPVRCGNCFRPEFDHRDPRNNGGPTALSNFDDLCHDCHEEKTEEDRKAGKLKPRKRKPPDP